MNSDSAKELDRVEKQFNEFDRQVKELTQDRMNAAPLEEKEEQTKIAQKDRNNMKDIYLKPKRTIGSREKFNEAWRKEYEYDKEYVYFEAENHEIIGETLEFWTKPYPGMPAEEWAVPVNTPLWGPRYVAQRIKNCKYHRLVMKQNVKTQENGYGEFYGAMAADSTIQRLDAKPAAKKTSLFMGARDF